ncbi:hypothetical protein M2273_002616 [Mucilaginibacter lappiensis]|jgi:hypothetical protein
MIIVPLGYQFQDDIVTYNLPLPKHTEKTDKFILKFNTHKDFFLYSMLLTDIRDRLEFEIIMSKKIYNLNKLIFCKKLLRCINQVRIITSNTAGLQND